MLYWKGECESAEDLLRQALEADPDFAMGHMVLADALRRIVNVRKNLGGEPIPPEEYLSYAKRGLELSAGVAERERLLIRGKYLDMTGQYVDAVVALQAVLRLNPNEIGALRTLHRIYFSSSNGMLNHSEGGSWPTCSPTNINCRKMWQ